MMNCARYDVASGTCTAAVRNEVSAKEQESNLLDNDAGPICQDVMSNPISDAYGTGPGCAYGTCGSMGTFARGESHTIMWFARGHAEDDQTPGSIHLYVSPLETAAQGSDVSMDMMRKTPICTGLYSNCNPANGATAVCTAQCTMPTSLEDGYYTLMWRWDWNSGENYTTCADIKIAGGAALSASEFSNVPCSKNDDCSSNVCGINGFCLAKSSKLGAGGIAAIVFAFLLVLVIVGAIGFLIINKKEVAYVFPFKGRV